MSFCAHCRNCRCLLEWQKVRRSQGLARKALQCEICRTPWRLNACGEDGVPPVPFAAPPRGFWALQGWRLSRLRAWVMEHLRAPSFPILILRAYRAWVLLAAARRYEIAPGAATSLLAVICVLPVALLHSGPSSSGPRG